MLHTNLRGKFSHLLGKGHCVPFSLYLSFNFLNFLSINYCCYAFSFSKLLAFLFLFLQSNQCGDVQTSKTEHHCFSQKKNECENTMELKQGKVLLSTSRVKRGGMGNVMREQGGAREPSRGEVRQDKVK